MVWKRVELDTGTNREMSECSFRCRSGYDKSQEKKEDELRVVAEIKKQFGAKIDLDRSPFVMIEIIRNFRHLLDENGGGGGVSTIAVGITPPAGEEIEVDNATLLREILNLHRTMKEIQKKLEE
jgi:hypothetical protein